MAERTAEGAIASLFWSLVWWTFLIVKVAGHTYAAWSWWWLLLPIVPVIGQLVISYGW